ncbi:phosphoribosyltransferase [Hydrogenophaga borbori]|uniref:Phosphoribosyltransferase n=1 Tax=Hydrogenophaga borbori TaxID=2294117 RepID=A0A372EK81_9BURK|nr:phosphoribosyltransferase family protein [Hydrogenophaga borbori]RFP79324.1 phosphoribosyltransferase [Hydrogenophaga borbori]
MFHDRLDAARQLAAALAHHRGSHPLVLAIPRGAVPMAAHLAQTLGGELDIVLVRKLPAPYSNEFAVGSVDESGWVYVAPHANLAGADADYLARVRREQLAEIARRRAAYTPGRAAASARGRTVIVVDDGLATGATMLAALHAVRQRAPAHLVCAVPVGSRESVALVRPAADELVCLLTPADFQAVGQFYAHFPQVEDAEVVRALRAAADPAAPGGAGTPP